MALYIHNTTEGVAILDGGREYNGEAEQQNDGVGVGGGSCMHTGYRLHTIRLSWV